MPTYSYLNTQTNEYEDLTMTIAEMVEFEKENPHMERQYDRLNMVDPITAGVTRPPADFQKYVLGKIKARNPLGSVEKRWNLKKEI